MKLSDEQVEQFDAAVDRWKELLQLGDWRIERGNKPIRDAMAAVEFNDAGRLATYRVGDFGAAEITPESISATALHEVLHVFLHDLLISATSRDDDIEMQEHRVINLLESLLTRLSDGKGE